MLTLVVDNSRFDPRLDEKCPTCNARPGERCRPYSLTEPHLARGQLVEFAGFHGPRDFPGGAA